MERVSGIRLASSFASWSELGVCKARRQETSFAARQSKSSAGRANGRRQALWEAFSGTARRHRFVHGVKY